jgi:uncharacterized membrane protein HdeD (DUF308 family)
VNVRGRRPAASGADHPSGGGAITRRRASVGGVPREEAIMATGTADDHYAEAAETMRDVTGFWWLWLITGTAWIFVAVIVLQFDQASVTTVGIIIGLMFLFSGVEQFVAAGLAEGGARWVAIGFGVLLVIAGVISLVNPENTFAGFADILGFLFLIVAAGWIIAGLMSRDTDDLWWLTLLAGILMVILAFWTGGQFLIDKAYLLLVFAGIWALMHGVTDFVRAFGVRRLHRALE